MKQSIFNMAINELLDDTVIIKFSAYTDKNFWHYRKLAKRISKKKNFSIEEINFFEANGINEFAREDFYFSILKKWGKRKNDYKIINYCNLYFLENAKLYKNHPLENYYSEKCA